MRRAYVRMAAMLQLELGLASGEPGPALPGRGGAAAPPLPHPLSGAMSVVKPLLRVLPHEATLRDAIKLVLLVLLVLSAAFKLLHLHAPPTLYW